MDYELIQRLEESRKLLYVHGMLSGQENERAIGRIAKFRERVENVEDPATLFDDEDENE